MAHSERPGQNIHELDMVKGFLQEIVQLEILKEFVISGPENKPVEFSDFVLIGQSSSGEVNVKTVTARGPLPFDVYVKVLKLKPPVVARRFFNIAEDTIVKKALENADLPYIVIGMGEVNNTKEEVVSMFCLPSMSIGEAFAEAQEKVWEKVREQGNKSS